MKKFLILFLLVPTLAMSGTFKDDEGKFGLKTKKSGFKFHLNFMDHNDHNFQYIKDKTKARAGKYFQRFELRDGDCFGDDGWRHKRWIMKILNLLSHSQATQLPEVYSRDHSIAMVMVRTMPIKLKPRRRLRRQRDLVSGLEPMMVSW